MIYNRAAELKLKCRKYLLKIFGKIVLIKLKIAEENHEEHFEIFLVVSIILTIAFGRHFPFCKGHGGLNTGQCHGYAMVKAYGGTVGGECGATSLENNNDIDEGCF